jgi:hypothetical protein
MASPDQVSAGVDAMALGLTGRGQAGGIHDEGLGRETARPATRAFKPGPLRAGSFIPGSLISGSAKPAPLRAAPIGSSPIEATPLGTSTSEPAAVRATALKATPLRTPSLKTASLGPASLKSGPLGTTTLKSGPLGTATLKPAGIGAPAHRTAHVTTAGLGPAVVGLAVQGGPFAPAAGAVRTALPAGLVTVASPFGLRTTEAGGAPCPAAPGPRPLVRTAFKSWAHGVSRWLWIVLLQVI